MEKERFESIFRDIFLPPLCMFAKRRHLCYNRNMKKLDDLLVDGMKIYQDDGLYKFTSDSVLLSRFARAKKNEIAADFCAGSGIVGLHFYALNRRVIRSLDLFEMQKELFELSKESIALNKLTNVTAHLRRLQDIGGEFTEKFTLILCNPPYFPKEKAQGEPLCTALCKYELSITLEEVVQISAKCLRFGGRLCMVYPSERLAELMYLLKKYKLEPKRLMPVAGAGKVYSVLVEAVKGGKAGLKIELPAKN